jgi:hypothetical protein
VELYGRYSAAGRFHVEPVNAQAGKWSRFYPDPLAGFRKAHRHYWFDCGLTIGSVGTYKTLAGTAHHQNVLTGYIQQFNQEQKNAADICKWALTDEQAKWFDAYGLEHVAISDTPHKHAFSRACANHILLRDAAAAITGPCTVLQTKTGKVTTLARVTGQRLTYHQMSVSPKDLNRYGVMASLPVSITDKIALLDETLQSMSLEETAGLLAKYENVDRWLFPCNIAYEAKYRSESAHAHYALEFSADGKNVSHILENDQSDHYTQPIASCVYLEISHLTVGDQVWTFERTASVGSNHLITAVRGRFLTPMEDILESPGLVVIPTFGRELPVRWMDATIYSQALAQAYCLKTYARRDAYAKLRTYMKAEGKRLPPLVLDHVATLLVKVVALDTTESSLPPQMQSLRYRIKAAIRRWFHKHLPRMARLLFGMDQLLLDCPELYMPPLARFTIIKAEHSASPAASPYQGPPSTPRVAVTEHEDYEPPKSKVAVEDTDTLALDAAVQHGIANPASMFMRDRKGNDVVCQETSAANRFRLDREEVGFERRGCDIVVGDAPAADAFPQGETEEAATAAQVQFQKELEANDKLEFAPRSENVSVFEGVPDQPDPAPMPRTVFENDAGIGMPTAMSVDAAASSAFSANSSDAATGAPTRRASPVPEVRPDLSWQIPRGAGAFMPHLKQYIVGVQDDGTRADPRTPYANTCIIRAIAKTMSLPTARVWEVALERCTAQEIASAGTTSGMTIRAMHKILCGLDVSLNLARHKGTAPCAYVPGLPYYLGALEGSCYAASFVHNAPGTPNHVVGLPPNTRAVGPRTIVSYGPAPQVLAADVALGRRAGATAPFVPPAPSVDRARKYQPDFKMGRTAYEGWTRNEWGCVFDNMTKAEIAELKVIFTGPVQTRGPLWLSVTIGAPGSGKSVAVKKWLRFFSSRLNSQLHVIFTRKALLQDWKNVFKTARREPDKIILKTLEVSQMSATRFVHIEELQQFPPGYIDMKAFLNPGLERVSATGDPLQNPFTTKDVLSPLNTAVNPLAYLRGFWCNYNVVMHRCSQIVAHCAGLETTSKVVGRIFTTPAINPNLPLLQARIPTNAEGALRGGVVTFSSCTGLEYPGHIQIVVDKAALDFVSFENCFTAFTRGRANVILVLQGTTQKMLDVHPFWGPVSRSQTIDHAHFKHPLHRTSSGVLDLNVRAGLKPIGPNHEDKLASLDPGYQALWAYVDEEELDFNLPIEVRPEEPVARTHIAVPHDLLGTRFFETPASKEAMEYTYQGTMSNQIRDLHGDPFTNSVFAKQDTSDPTLLPSSVKKRLRQRSLESNLEHAREREFLGRVLLGRLFDQTGLDPATRKLEPERMDRARNANLRKKLEKSTETLENNKDRTCPDQDINSASIFTKAQWKEKRSTILTATGDEYRADWWNAEDYAAVKPGQTLALFPDQVLEYFGPVTRYIHEIMSELLPDRVLLMGGNSPAQLQEWSRRHAKRGLCLTNDFTAYDQSCTGEALWFELLLMEWLGFPKEFLDFYHFMKVDLNTTYGHSAIMRFTGEPGTYIFNTLYNLAYMLLRYIMALLSLMLGGDDSLVFGVPADNPDFARLERFFTLVGKTFITDLPECCGWLHYPEGIVRDPLTLALKTATRAGRPGLADVLDNYFMESLYGYALGDQIYDLLSPELLECHGWFLNFCASRPGLVKHFSVTHRTDITNLITKDMAMSHKQAQHWSMHGLFQDASYIFHAVVRFLTDNTDNERSDDDQQLRVRGGGFGNVPDYAHAAQGTKQCCRRREPDIELAHTSGPRFRPGGSRNRHLAGCAGPRL